MKLSKRNAATWGAGVFCLLTIVSFQNCSSRQGGDQVATSASDSADKVSILSGVEGGTDGSTTETPTTNETTTETPADPLVGPGSHTLTGGSTLQLQMSGGTLPYAFSTNGCSSTISADGLFTAGTVSEICVVVVTDAKSQTSYGTVQVLAALSATTNPARIHVKDIVVINVQGGMPPYKYELTAGAGVLTDNVYKTTSSSENAIVTVSDSNGQSLQVNLNVLIPDDTLTAVSVVNEGQTCPSGFVAAGGTLVSNLDAQNSPVMKKLKNLLLKRSQTLCVKTYDGSQATVITDAVLGLKRSAKPCQDGYVEGGRFKEIIDGSVAAGTTASFFLCVKNEPIAQAKSFVRNLYFGPLCDSEDQIVGAVGRMSALYLKRLKDKVVLGPKVQLLCLRKN